MSDRPRASLGRVLDDLGATLLELVAGEVDVLRAIGGVVIYDPVDEPVYPEHALVLGIGLQSADDLERVVDDLGAARASALVVRAPVALDERVLAAVERSGVSLLGLARGATWAQVAALLRTMLAEGDVGAEAHESLGGLPSGDLFAVANAIASLVDAPVTIEDRSSRVLAFSGGQEEVDASRAETIVGRRVPERYARRLTEHGVFRDLYRDDGPVVVDPGIVGDQGLTTQRVAIAVRAGDEVLGSIWAAMDGPMTPARTASLREASKLAALHLLRVRAGADVQRRLTAELVSTALDGGTGARDALRRLRLAGQQVLVLGASSAPEATAGRRPKSHEETLAEGQRLADAFAVHLSTRSPGAVTALIGDIAYGLLPVTGDPAKAPQRAAQIAEDFVERVGGRLHAMVGVGTVGRETAGIARSRAAVDRALRVLRDLGAERRVATIDDVYAAALMADLADLVLARGDRGGGSIARLLRHDRDHDTTLVETLTAWLDHFGDVGSAAKSLGVHPNTFRYRLRRAAHIGEVDLGDVDHRFALMLELRLLPHLSNG